jgi:hypothetical protein
MTPTTRAKAVAHYKSILRSTIDRRPSGTRQKIALALGKNKSFVSQITNPAYASPVPAPQLQPIFEICQFSPEERDVYLRAYQAAHPKQGAVAVGGTAGKTHHLRIRVPVLADPKLQKELEATIRQTAARIIALVTRS